MTNPAFDFDRMTYHGYKLEGFTFACLAPLKGQSAPPKTKPHKISGLMVRDHGLAGGQIHMMLEPGNHRGEQPECWYAVRCDVNQEALQKGRQKIGFINLRRMSPDERPLADKKLVLEELDTSHLIDRLQGEVIKWHAKTYGPGPFAPAVAAPAKAKHRAKR